MPRGYLVTCYRHVSGPERLAAYAQLSKPAIEANGGRILARGPAARVFEQGVTERTVIVEFESAAAAIAAFESAEYRHALDVLGDAAERDVRIIEGV